MALIAWTTPAHRRGRVVAAMVGAVLPDLDKPSTVFFGGSPFPPALDAFHQVIQRESPRRMPQEVIVWLLGAAAVGWLCRRSLAGEPRRAPGNADARPGGCSGRTRHPLPTERPPP
jgi:hypothetical protein